MGFYTKTAKKFIGGQTILVTTNQIVLQELEDTGDFLSKF